MTCAPVSSVGAALGVGIAILVNVLEFYLSRVTLPLLVKCEPGAALILVGSVILAILPKTRLFSGWLLMLIAVYSVCFALMACFVVNDQMTGPSIDLIAILTFGISVPPEAIDTAREIKRASLGTGEAMQADRVGCDRPQLGSVDRFG